jgi:hypothetical protein
MCCERGNEINEEKHKLVHTIQSAGLRSGRFRVPLQIKDSEILAKSQLSPPHMFVRPNFKKGVVPEMDSLRGRVGR